MVTVFAVCAVVGVVVLVASLVLGDIDVGGFDGGDVGLPWVSAPALAAAVGVFGVVGWPLAAGTALSTPILVAVAAGCGIAAYALLMMVLRTLRRSQTGSVDSLGAAVGRTATVTMAIPEGGWGQVTYVDSESARSTTTAILANPQQSVGIGTQALIVDIDGDRLVVDPLLLQD